MSLMNRLRRAATAFREAPVPTPPAPAPRPRPAHDPDALAKETLARWRQYVIDNNLGTPEELGFDTPTERL